VAREISAGGLVVRRMRGRQELVAEHRARLFDLLRGLWTQLALGRDAASESGASPRPYTPVLALCAEIEDQLGVAAPAAPANSRGVSKLVTAPR